MLNACFVARKRSTREGAALSCACSLPALLQRAQGGVAISNSCHCGAMTRRGRLPAVSLRDLRSKSWQSVRRRSVRCILFRAALHLCHSRPRKTAKMDPAVAEMARFPYHGKTSEVVTDRLPRRFAPRNDTERTLPRLYNDTGRPLPRHRNDADAPLPQNGRFLKALSLHNIIIVNHFAL